MSRFQRYTCLETCGQVKECGNRYCSANSRYRGSVQKKKQPKPQSQRRDERRSFYAPKAWLEDEE